MFDLTGKTALVTGASGGIGRATALALYQGGASLALSGTREAALQETADLLRAENKSGGAVHIVPANLSDADAPSSLAEAAEAALGQIDILVNNAGITRDMLTMRLKDEDWENVLSVNLTAAFKLTRAVIKGMIKRRWGRVISISSIVGVTGNPGQANYVAAKAGLIGFSKSLAQEVGTRGLTVNCIAPGFIVTDMTASLSDDHAAALKAKIPQGRLGEPEDIAAGVRYLASEEAAYITGQTLHINGGMAML